MGSKLTNLANNGARCGLVLLLAAATARGAPPDAQAEAAVPAGAPESAADAAFRRGEELWAQQLRDEALREFERAYQISPAYEVLYFIAAVSVELGRWVEARRAFELYLQLGGTHIEPEQQAAVRQHLEVLGARTATLSVTLNVPDAEVHVDGARHGSTTISGLVVAPGKHTVRVSKPGFAPVEQIVHASDGENVHIVVPLVRHGLDSPGPRPGSAPPYTAAVAHDAATGPERVWLPWVITGALGAGWLATALLAVQAGHDRDTIEQPSTSAERIDSARRLHVALAVTSDVLLLSTLAAGGISAYLTWWQPEAPAAIQAHATNADGAPSARGGWALHVSGRF